jgi:1D-myo-inositol 3-kinase
MEMPITCVAAGHVTHDRVEAGLVPGGCAYYAAMTWLALDARSRLVTTVGEDFACREALSGIETRIRVSGRTTVFTNLYPAHGPRVQTVEALAPDVEAGQLPNDWLRPDVLFLGPVMAEVSLADWKDRVGARLLAIGVQGYIRAQENTRVIPHRWNPSDAELEGIDVACLSEEDLQGQGNLLERLRETVPVVALTRDRKGCDIITTNWTTWVGIHPARVVDPTGAGDTFAAGFLFALARGEPPVRAARLGAAAASIIIEGHAGDNFGRMGEAFERAARVIEDRRTV